MSEQSVTFPSAALACATGATSSVSKATTLRAEFMTSPFRYRVT